jgi:hypothetical protein
MCTVRAERRWRRRDKCVRARRNTGRVQFGRLAYRGTPGIPKPPEFLSHSEVGSIRMVLGLGESQNGQLLWRSVVLLGCPLLVGDELRLVGGSLKLLQLQPQALPEDAALLAGDAFHSAERALDRPH